MLSTSVVICAYTERRWDDLCAAVHSVREQSPPPEEIVVVCDHNDALLARVGRELGGVVAVANDGPRGLSGARNAGVQAAGGDVIAFLDDDAVAASGWLGCLLEPYTDPGVIGVGGTIDPLWPGRRPAAMPAEFDWVVGCTYRGVPGTRQPVRNLIGANMSIRRSVFDAIGGFRTDVGRVGTRPVGCEETELCIRARKALPASQFVFEPRARVRHRVTPERARARYFRARCWSEGRSKAVVARHAGSGDALSTERRYVRTVLPSGIARGVRDAVANGDVAGLARASAIVAGVVITAAGYAAGTLQGRVT
jgi:GT2 family glycosyltransferase